MLTLSVNFKLIISIYQIIRVIELSELSELIHTRSILKEIIFGFYTKYEFLEHMNFEK